MIIRATNNVRVLLYKRGKRGINREKRNRCHTRIWHFCANLCTFRSYSYTHSRSRYIAQDFVALLKFTFALFTSLAFNMIITALFFLSSEPLLIIRICRKGRKCVSCTLYTVHTSVYLKHMRKKNERALAICH